jgi:MFS family permease
MSTQAIDLHEELAEAKVGKFHWRLGAIMGLLTLFDGYDTFNPAYVIHYVAKPWGLQAGQAGLLISSGLVGFLLGAAIHGIIADRLGRRGTLLGGLWITSIFTLLTATSADSFLSFCILRLLTGIGLGVLLPLATTYINELAPRRVANTFALWGVALGWALGGTLAGVAGVFATPVFGWTSLYWIGSLSFLLLPFVHFMLPESPKFLALQGRTGEIRDMLSKLRPERAAVYKSAEISVGHAEKPVNSVAVLLHAKYRRTTFAIWASAFLSLFCIFGLSGWIPTVMMQRGETFAASFGFGALMQIMSFVGALVLGHLVDRSGSSRGLIATWWAIGGVGALPGVHERPHRQHHVGRGRRLLHHRRAIRAEQLHRGLLRDRRARHRGWNGTRGRARRCHSRPVRRRRASAILPESDPDVPVDRRLRDRRRGDRPAGPTAGERPRKQP